MEQELRELITSPLPPATTIDETDKSSRQRCRIFLMRSRPGGGEFFEKLYYPGKFLKIVTLGKFLKIVTLGKF
jgi:hypothetical protein